MGYLPLFQEIGIFTIPLKQCIFNLSSLNITMRPFVVVSALFSLALASPVAQSQDIQARQMSGSDANDVQSGSCHDVTFIFARGSTETGNMVRLYRSLLGVNSTNKLSLIGNRCRA